MNMYIKIAFIIALILYYKNLYSTQILDYKIYYGIIFSQDKETPDLIIRKYKINKKDFFLTINPETLNTAIKLNTTDKIIETSFPYLRENYKNTKYIKLLIEAEKNSDKLQNSGIISIVGLKDGAVITADLCPSKHSFDKIVTDSISEKYKSLKGPVPIAFCITGLWIENHQDDIKYIQLLEKNNIINPLYINHSYNHKFNKNLKLEKNFLLIDGTDIQKEILFTEKKMIESGILPSIFFRFPGLISSSNLFNKIIEFGLIPVGSDAWLAKNQNPSDGSIILVHANGNEPLGIKRLIKFLENKKNDIINKRWKLYDLREALILLKFSDNKTEIKHEKN